MISTFTLAKNPTNMKDNSVKSIYFNHASQGNSAITAH